MSLPDSNHSLRLYWLCQSVGWGLYTGTRIVVATIYLDLSWLASIGEVCVLSALAIGFTHLLRNIMRRQRWSDLKPAPLLLRIAVAGTLLGTVMGIVTQFTDLVYFQDPSRFVPGLLVHYSAVVLLLLNIVNWAAIFIIWMALYWVISGIRQHKSSELKQSELARALQSAELRLLKSQLNPHFMFNALNAVRSLIAEDPKRAQGAVTRLANTLRYTLSASQGDLVTLAHELKMVEDYLELETMRFEERLRIEWSVAADARSVRIPAMLLQTVVENAVKHGIAALPEGGVLTIDGRLENTDLVLKVENPRPVAGSPPSGGGIGLRNAAERLRLIFGVRASLEVDFSRPAQATVRIRIPQTA